MERSLSQKRLRFKGGFLVPASLRYSTSTVRSHRVVVCFFGDGGSFLFNCHGVPPSRHSSPAYFWFSAGATAAISRERVAVLAYTASSNPEASVESISLKQEDPNESACSPKLWYCLARHLSRSDPSRYILDLTIERLKLPFYK